MIIGSNKLNDRKIPHVMDIILKGCAKMIIWINLRVRILGKRTVDFFIRDPSVNCNFGILILYKVHLNRLKLPI